MFQDVLLEGHSLLEPSHHYSVRSLVIHGGKLRTQLTAPSGSPTNLPASHTIVSSWK